MTQWERCQFAIALLLCAQQSRAELLFASIFTGGAVLQRNEWVTIWGITNGPGQHVTLYVDGMVQGSTTSEDGNVNLLLVDILCTCELWMTNFA